MAGSKEIPESVQDMISKYVPHAEMIRHRKWEIWNTRGTITKLVYCVVNPLIWSKMLGKQEKRLQRKNTKDNIKLGGAKAAKRSAFGAMSKEERKDVWKKRKKHQKKRKKRKRLKQGGNKMKRDPLRVVASYKTLTMYQNQMRGQQAAQINNEITSYVVNIARINWNEDDDTTPIDSAIEDSDNDH
eukprot:368723_1